MNIGLKRLVKNGSIHSICKMSMLQAWAFQKYISLSPYASKVKIVTLFDLIHYITENGHRRASGPVHANIPSIAHLGYCWSANLSKMVFGKIINQSKPTLTPPTNVGCITFCDLSPPKKLIKNFVTKLYKLGGKGIRTFFVIYS